MEQYICLSHNTLIFPYIKLVFIPYLNLNSILPLTCVELQRAFNFFICLFLLINVVIIVVSVAKLYG